MLKSLGTAPAEQEHPQEKVPYDTNLYKAVFEVEGTATQPISNQYTISFKEPKTAEGREFTEAIVTKNFFTEMINPPVAQVQDKVKVRIARLHLIADIDSLDRHEHPYAQFYAKHTWAITEVSGKNNSVPPESGEVEKAPESYMPPVLK